MKDEDWSRYPGGPIVQKGLHDLAEGIESIESVALLVARARLNFLGIPIPEKAFATSAEHRLYEMLCEEFGLDGYARYNALTRQLASFLNSYRR